MTAKLPTYLLKHTYNVLFTLLTDNSAYLP